jgi:hypothetical protein
MILVRSKLAPIELDCPLASTEWFEEPPLLFAGNSVHVDPKIGVPLYGPRSLGTYRHKQEVHVGFVGTAETVDRAQRFLNACAEGVDGDQDHAPFPGFRPDRGYRCQLRADGSLVELITRRESQDLLAIRNSRQRFETALDLLAERVGLLTQRDHPLDYVLVTLPEDLYKECRSVEYVDRGVGRTYRNLRRAFKASTMRFHKPTQLFRDSTTRLIPTRRQLDHESVIAWNLFTGLYFKVDGLPWGPTCLPPSSCFVGVSFFRPLGETSTLRTSVVQAFDENGEGLVLRGHDFHWDDEGEGRSPHLTEELAGALVEMVLDRYERERKQLPQRLVLHKSSRFEDPERSGFEQALRRVRQYDLVALSRNHDVRLVRAGKYPPLRGMAFTVGDVSYLYTTGFLISQDRYPHGHVPSPLQVIDHVGDTARSQLMREVLILTKMNWNSANMAALMPITLRFSRLVGDVLREVPSGETPEPKYRYYI